MVNVAIVACPRCCGVCWSWRTTAVYWLLNGDSSW